MEIYIVRHTQVAISRDYCYGISDVELADSQQEDIRKVKEKMKFIHFQKSYTSPLKRCRLLANELSEEAISKDALLEMDFGDWELKKWDELNREKVDVWMNDFVNERPPKGESYIYFSMKFIACNEFLKLGKFRMMYCTGRDYFHFSFGNFHHFI